MQAEIYRDKERMYANILLSHDICPSKWNVMLQIGVLPFSWTENNSKISEPTYPTQLTPHNVMSIVSRTVLEFAVNWVEFHSTVYMVLFQCWS
jgi:hypothetical protein